MEPLTLKIVLLVITLLVTLVAGLAPVRVLKVLRRTAAAAVTVSEHRSASLTLCLLTCFSGGVFLATCFLDLLPAVNDHLGRVKQSLNFHSDYPFAELLSCLGFFLVFGLEELVLKLMPGFAHVHDKRDSVTPSHLRVQHDERLPVSSPISDNVKEKSADSDGLTASPVEGNGDNCGGALLNEEVIFVDGCRSKSSRVETATMTQLTAEMEQMCSSALAEPERCEMNCEGRDEHPPIYMTSRPHAHSHGVRSITFVLALSFHSLLEGLAFGFQSERREIVSLFVSVTVHKAIVAFSVGLQLARTHAHQLRWVAVSILTFSLMTPSGAVVGMLVQQSQMDDDVKSIIVLTFEGLAVGTFLYVTFFEVLLHERDNEHPNLLKLLVIMIGFALIGALRLLDHGHDGPSQQLERN